MLVDGTTARFGTLVAGRAAALRTRCELVPPRLRTFLRAFFVAVTLLVPTLVVETEVEPVREVGSLVASEVPVVGLTEVEPPGAEEDGGCAVGVGVGLGVVAGSSGSAEVGGTDGETPVTGALGVGRVGRTPLEVAVSDGVGEVPCVGELVEPLVGEPVEGVEGVEGSDVEVPEPDGLVGTPGMVEGDDVPVEGVLGVVVGAPSRGSSGLLDGVVGTTTGGCSVEVGVVGASGPLVTVVSAETGDDGRPSTVVVGPMAARTLGRSVGDEVDVGTPAARISACSTCWLSWSTFAASAGSGFAPTICSSAETILRASWGCPARSREPIAATTASSSC